MNVLLVLLGSFMLVGVLAKVNYPTYVYMSEWCCMMDCVQSITNMIGKTSYVKGVNQNHPSAQLYGS